MDLTALSEKIYSHPYIRVGTHVLFWTGEWLLTWHLTTISFNTYNTFDAPVLWQLSFANTINLILAYYPLVYWLIPALQRRKYVTFFSGTLGLLLFYTLVSALTEKLILIRCASCMEALRNANNGYYAFLQLGLPNRVFAKLASLGALINLILSISLPLAIKIAIEVFRQRIAVIKLAKENVELEFSFLKSQVNPHFLFNSLNNIYGLILKKENDKAAGTVARLAEFMRYTLVDSTEAFVPLQTEIRLLENYIELEKIRLNHVRVDVELKCQDSKVSLPALLLMPVIENAFKYSGDRPGDVITIQVTCQSGRLFLRSTNPTDGNRQRLTGAGIGLRNLKKRLELYYSGNYTYDVVQTGLHYTATLEIRL